MPEPLDLLAHFPPTATTEWEEAVRRDLQGADPRRLDGTPSPSVTMRPFYRREDGLPFAPSLPERLRAGGTGWTIAEAVAGPEATAALERGQAALAGGAEALLVPAALGSAWAEAAGPALREAPTHWMGPAETAWVRRLLHDDELPRPWRNATAALALGRACFRAQRAEPLAEAIGLVAEADEAGSGLRFLAVDVVPWQEAGAALEDELGLAAALVHALLEAGHEQDVAPEAAMRRLYLRLPVGTAFFPEVAKLRAARLLVAALARAFGVDAPPPVPVLAETSRRHQALLDPHVNLLRGTTAAAAAVLGGCDVLAVRPFDAAEGDGSPLGHRLARNTQLLLRHEAHLGRVANPAAGSYYVEQLTAALARAAWRLLQEVTARGGLFGAQASGWLGEHLAARRAAAAEALARRRRVMVGVNQYPPPEPGLAGAMPPPLEAGARLAAPFEALHRQAGGDAPPVAYLLPFGPPAARTARAGFARDFLGCGGFAVVEGSASETPDDHAGAIAAYGAHVVALCSSDEAYLEAGAALARALKALPAAPLVVVAGPPPADDAALRAAGVDAFIHLRAPLLDTLRLLLAQTKRS